MQYLKSYFFFKNKILHLLPQIIYLFILFFMENNKNMLQRKENKTKPSMCGKIKSVHKEKGLKLPIQKSSHLTCFFFHPQIVPAKFSQKLQEK
jgi:hypothetical protein